MSMLLKLIKYLVILLVLAVVLAYATLLPKPYLEEIKAPIDTVSKNFNGRLKIITFNLGLLDIRVLGLTVFKPTEFIKERAKVIPENLLKRNADIIALQEIYEKRDIEFFIQKLKHTYPYHFYYHHSLVKLNNGLMIFSKYPIVDSEGLSQEEKGPIDEMLIADRGILSSKIKLNNNTFINIINLHVTSGGTLNSQNTDKINLMRTRQLEQALKLSFTKNVNYQVILGDINAGPNISAINYKYLLENDFTDAYAAFSSRTGNTALPTWTGDNPLNAMRGYTAKDNQRIDHIYLSKRLSVNSSIRNAGRIFDEDIVEVDGKMYPLSDHYGIEVDLQFH